ncbi:MAG: hypothetical protein JWO37_3974 [Acidimicrobiales bacterium]|jgi:hypothetical protein|nr:hypothetical protein [Acidimicrobiales bacterium]
MRIERWVNPTQPQTLQIAVFLFYFNAVFQLIGALDLLGLAIAIGFVAAGVGIANEYKWGYLLGVVMAFMPFLLRLAFFGDPIAGAGVLGLMFDVALVALLLHPQSRDYQRIWFK